MAHKVFLSHASFDAEIAAYLKDELERRIPGIEVFLSSDPTDLPPGVIWPDEIQRELQESEVLILLATKRSLSRPWVWFETGTVWFRTIPLIPVCLGDVRKNALPTPLSQRQAINVDSPADLVVLLRRIGQIVRSEVAEQDVTSMARRLAEFERKTVAITAGAMAGWLGVEWNNRFLAYDGPIEGLMLIEDEAYQETMMSALEAGGYKVRLGHREKVGRHAEKGYRIVYLTDRRTWRRRITQIDTVLLARPAG